MGAEHDHFGAEWKRAFGGAVRSALDLILPRDALDGEDRVGAHGLPAETWSRIHFLDGPVCDGCGQPVSLITASAMPLSSAKKTR
jgi:hypothetical protein